LTRQKKSWNAQEQKIFLRPASLPPTPSPDEMLALPPAAARTSIVLKKGGRLSAFLLFQFSILSKGSLSEIEVHLQTNKEG
jgi:hypothetical protein